MTDTRNVCSPSVAYILAMGAVALTAKIGVPDFAVVGGMLTILSHQVYSVVSWEDGL